MWVRKTAAELNSDGCSNVTELFHEACLEHDIAYRTGFAPRELFYGISRRTSRSEADARFREEMQRRSKLGRFSPIASLRWVGVRIFGYFAWKHK